jgi:predicted membrane channel-forming protein YqfA (hemolysin III family)
MNMAPYLAFLVCATLCMTFSTIMHTFWIKSKSACKCFLCLDFAGIATLVSGSTISVVWFAAYYLEFTRNVYIIIMVVVGILALFITNLPIFIKNDPLKAAVYFCQAAVALVPLFHWTI